jgi:hypothetical protein
MGTEDLANARRQPCLREDLYSGLADAARLVISRRASRGEAGRDAVHALRQGRVGRRDDR